VLNTSGGAATRNFYFDYFDLTFTAAAGTNNLYYHRFASLSNYDAIYGSIYDLTNKLINELAITGSSTANGRVVDRNINLKEVFMDCVIGEDITDAAAISGTELGATKTNVASGNIAEGALSAQLENPRNVTIVVTTDGGGAFVGNVVITGTTSDGATGVTDTIVCDTALGTVKKRYHGVKALVRITNVAYPATNQGGNVQQLWFSFGNKLGIANQLSAAVADVNVYHVKKNAANLASAAYTVNAQYGTIDMAVGGVIQIAAGDDITVWYKACTGTRD